MVFETHTLDHGIDFYYKPIQKYYPAAISLGYTLKQLNPHKSRMFILFGKDMAIIDKLVKRNFVYVKPYFNNLFIMKHNHLTQSEIIELSNVLLEKHKNYNLIDYSNKDFVFGNETYFEVLLAGFAEYLANNQQVLPDNIFVSFFKHYAQINTLDSNLTEITKNETWTMRKIANKYDDFYHIINGDIDMVAPMEITPDETGTLSFTKTTGEIIKCKNIDGHHRFFMCELAGIDKFHYLVNSDDNSWFLDNLTVIPSNYTLSNP